MPAASVALTITVWPPFARPLYDFGELHAATALPSSWQVADVAVASATPKLTEAAFDARFDHSTGDEIVTTGAVASMVTDTAALLLPTALEAVTVKVCVPSLSPL